MSTKIISNSGNSVFAIFIGFEAEITGKILKKRPIFSKNIIEIVSLQYHCSKTEFRVAAVRPVPEVHFTETGGGGRNSELRSSLPPVNLSGLHKQLEHAKPFAAVRPVPEAHFTEVWGDGGTPQICSQVCRRQK